MHQRRPRDRQQARFRYAEQFKKFALVAAQVGVDDQRQIIVGRAFDQCELEQVARDPVAVVVVAAEQYAAFVDRLRDRRQAEQEGPVVGARAVLHQRRVALVAVLRFGAVDAVSVEHRPVAGVDVDVAQCRHINAVGLRARRVHQRVALQMQIRQQPAPVSVVESVARGIDVAGGEFDHRQRLQRERIVGAGGEQVPAIGGEPRVVAEARGQRQPFAQQIRIARREAQCTVEQRTRSTLPPARGEGFDRLLQHPVRCRAESRKAVTPSPRRA